MNISSKVGAIVVATLMAVISTKLVMYHKAALEEAKQEIVTEYDKDYVLDLEDQLKKSRELAETASLRNKEDEAKINDLTRRNAELADSLRKRPARPKADASSPNPPESTCQNTGAGLYREDGEFLAGEAAYADRILIERDTAYKLYEEAQLKLKELNGKD